MHETSQKGKTNPLGVKLVINKNDQLVQIVYEYIEPVSASRMNKYRPIILVKDEDLQCQLMKPHLQTSCWANQSQAVHMHH